MFPQTGGALGAYARGLTSATRVHPNAEEPDAGKFTRLTINAAEDRVPVGYPGLGGLTAG